MKSSITRLCRVSFIFPCHNCLGANSGRGIRLLANQFETKKNLKIKLLPFFCVPFSVLDVVVVVVHWTCASSAENSAPCVLVASVHWNVSNNPPLFRPISWCHTQPLTFHVFVIYPRIKCYLLLRIYVRVPDCES